MAGVVALWPPPAQLTAKRPLYRPSRLGISGFWCIKVVSTYDVSWELQKTQSNHLLSSKNVPEGCQFVVVLIA